MYLSIKKNDGREYVWGGKTTGENMSWMEKRREGICLGWKNDWREYDLVVKNDEREYVREGIFPSIR